MNQELARKLPANTQTRPRPALQGRVTVRFSSRANLDRKVTKLHRQGRILSEWTVRPRNHEWYADLTFIEPPTPPARHRRPTSWLKIWAISMVSIMALMTGWMVAQAIALAVAAMIPFVVGGALILLAVVLLAGRKVINISQNVNIR